MIRRATALDVAAMIGLLDAALPRSIYAGRVEIDRQAANALFTQFVQRHGGKGKGGTFAMVSVDGASGEVNGMLIGALTPIYEVGDLCTATDIYWLTNEKASAWDSAKLMLVFLDWAKAHPKAIEVVCGATGALGDWEKAGGQLEKMGLTRYGGMYRMEAKAA